MHMGMKVWNHSLSRLNMSDVHLGYSDIIFINVTFWEYQNNMVGWSVVKFCTGIFGKYRVTDIIALRLRKRQAGFTSGPHIAPTPVIFAGGLFFCLACGYFCHWRKMLLKNTCSLDSYLYGTQDKSLWVEPFFSPSLYPFSLYLPIYLSMYISP